MTEVRPALTAITTMQDLFGAPRALIGMLHLGALPGTPRAAAGIDAVVETAVKEARVYRDAGFQGLMIENMHDRPYPRGSAGAATVATMAVAGREIRREVSLPLGVQVLAGANREALAVALACGASFIRAEAFVFAHIADEGILEADAGTLLRYRREIGADGVRVFADIKKKHAAHAITADVDLAETARAAEFNLADGVIVTGVATGRRTDPADVRAVAVAVRVPVWVGSGVGPDDIGKFDAAHGFIVGSSVKCGGLWSEPLDPDRVASVVKAFERVAVKS